MLRVNCDEEGDLFFDACDDHVRSSIDASTSVGCSTSDQVSPSWRSEYELWTSEPMSVVERRHRFLKGMGFAESIPTGTAFSNWQREITADCAVRGLEGEFSGICSTSWSSFSQAATAPDSAYCIRDLDSGNRFVVHEIKPRGLTRMLEEFETDSGNQCEGYLSFSQLVREFWRKGHGCIPAKWINISCSVKQKDHKSFCVRFTSKKREARICVYDVPEKSLKTNTMCRTKVQQQNKSWMDFSAVHMCQEIQAHGGSIRAMKFSPSGWHLASVGDDYVVCIWMIREVESSPDLYGREPPGKYMDRTKGLNMKRGKGQSRTLAIIPRKFFSISETPLHEFHGHTSDILDMTWSKSDVSVLLTLYSLGTHTDIDAICAYFNITIETFVSKLLLKPISVSCSFS
jgi:WD repeat-containing protein 44